MLCFVNALLLVEQFQPFTSELLERFNYPTKGLCSMFFLALNLTNRNIFLTTNYFSTFKQAIIESLTQEVCWWKVFQEKIFVRQSKKFQALVWIYFSERGSLTQHPPVSTKPYRTSCRLRTIRKENEGVSQAPVLLAVRFQLALATHWPAAHGIWNTPGKQQARNLERNR